MNELTIKQVSNIQSTWMDLLSAAVAWNWIKADDLIDGDSDFIGRLINPTLVTMEMYYFKIN